ncbi:hypothetical protein LQZ18_15580 [Lachnospiraceae bacterium ZAX-1]
MMMDVDCKIINLPTSVSAYTLPRNGESYTIVINANLTYERQLIAYQHELEHILNEDFEKDMDANLIEFEHRIKENSKNIS